MKLMLIYFSQTGYTLKAAEQIKAGATAVGAECKLFSMTEIQPERIHDYELIGLGFPVYYYQEPFNVRAFVQALPSQQGRYWFLYCTHGSVMGAAIYSVAKALQDKGALVIGYFDMYADATAPFIPFPTLTSGHPDDIDLATAREFGKEIMPRWERIKSGDLSLIPPLPTVEERWLNMAERFTPAFIKQITPGLYIDTEKCVQCGECEDNCPVAGIEVEATPPRIQDPCIYCFQCVMICPELAIEAEDPTGWDIMEQQIPNNYAIYRECLDEAAAQGRFRWLIDPDSINYEDTQLRQRRHKLNK